jgi:hypothetical protein
MLGPGEQITGERDDLEPELVGGQAVQGQVAQAGVLRATDPVLAAGPLPVAQLVLGDPAALTLVADTVMRQPSWSSVKRSCAPGCGRSLRPSAASQLARDRGPGGASG